ncbi:TIGR04063 family PEP-CTERM/XrtA system glycosyltransferase [Methylomarinum vadi]|uniref:TIGR04063 family PEP-CTERM/XrtA system glycosyltransferase n=1 Tax=Methylomarinum vadi TaxID=438855 RepID=UPI0004DF749C|nr:TIGR04063 family PEP-CTERM/XrtA system glycosyltransferase [Methylomarinum vadi]
MKILHILDHSIPLHSGYTFRTRAILEQQKKLGWETFHVTSAKHNVAEHSIEEIDGLTFYRSEIPSGFPAAWPVFNQWAIVKSLEKRLAEIIPEIKPDILHAHSPALNGLAALAAGKKFKLPVVYECRAFWEDAAVDHGTTFEGSMRYLLTHALETHVFKKADAVTTICEGLRNDIIGRGVPANKITVIPNAVDIDKFSFGQPANQELRKELDLTGCVVLGFIGSFYAYEGLPLLLEALPKILRHQPEVRLLLVGGGPQEELIRQKTKELGLGRHVVFTGRVPHDQVQEYYNQVEIFVYPRLPMRLTELVTPLKPLEAMAQGRLVVASDVGGHKELIDDRKNGYLFKADDVDALADTLLNLLERRSEWESVRERGRKFVEQKRNWPGSVANYENIYRRLVDQKKH